MGRLDSQKAGIQAQKGFLTRYALPERPDIKELAVRKPTTAELSEILGFVGSGVTRVDEQSRDIEAEKTC